MPISEKTLQFLQENRMQNSRTWYADHKQQYQEDVLKPLVELVEQMAPAMYEIDPLLVIQPKVDKCISRIYRDTRFSKDKSLYRSVMWCVFMRSKTMLPNPPALVFEFSPEGFRYGCGWYNAPTQSMEAVRQLILKSDRSFQQALKAYEKQDLFSIEGDLYKRPHFSDQPEKLQPWLERRGLALMKNSCDFELLFSNELADMLSDGFFILKPIYEFLCKAAECAGN